MITECCLLRIHVRVVTVFMLAVTKLTQPMFISAWDSDEFIIKLVLMKNIKYVRNEEDKMAT